jgi:hypothetical protein
MSAKNLDYVYRHFCLIKWNFDNESKNYIPLFTIK